MSQPRLLHTYADELSDLVTPIKPTPVYQPQLQVINHELCGMRSAYPKHGMIMMRSWDCYLIEIQF